MGEKRLISLNGIVGYLAMWAVRAYPHGWPYGLRMLIEQINSHVDREAAEWMTLADLKGMVDRMVDRDDYVAGWGRASGSGPGIEVRTLAQLIVESTWANGIDRSAAGLNGAEARDRYPIRVGERVRSLDRSSAEWEFGWCTVHAIDEHAGACLLVTEVTQLGAGWKVLADVQNPAIYERGGMVRPRRMTEREEARRAVEPNGEAREREEERGRRQVAREKRTKAIVDAAWWGTFTAALAGSAVVYWGGSTPNPEYAPEAFVKRATGIADAAASVVRTTGIVPPDAGFDLEVMAVDVEHEIGPRTTNITNNFGVGVNPEEIARIVRPDFDGQERWARAAGYASKLEKKLCALLAPHVGEVPGEQVSGAGAVEVLERILKGHRERRAAALTDYVTTPEGQEITRRLANLLLQHSLEGETNVVETLERLIAGYTAKS